MSEETSKSRPDDVTDPVQEGREGSGRKTPPQLWVSSTYFAEGFPYTLINNIADIMFEQLGASLQAIGLTSLFHLPWNLKFLWGPLLDQYETKRAWLIWTEVLLSVVILILAFVVGSGGDLWVPVSAGFLVLAFLSSTHDIAVDAYYLEALDEREQSAYVGWRATCYRISGVVLGGPLLWVIGWIGWAWGLGVMALMMALMTLYHRLMLPHVEARRRPIRTLARGLLRHLLGRRVLAIASIVALLILLARRFAWVDMARSFVAEWVDWSSGLGGWLANLGVSGGVALLLPVVLLALAGARTWRRRQRGGTRAAGGARESAGETSEYVQAFSSFMGQRGALVILSFVLLYRIGESFLTKMRWPFLHKVVGMELADYALVNGTIGVVASFSATLAGGWLISKFGLRRCIWPFVLAQNLLNLLYMVVASAEDPQTLGLAILGPVICIEQMGAGLGTAVLMVFLMRSCHPRHKAGHMAILTALMSVGFTVAGVISGYLAASYGYESYFGLTFVATIPSMMLIPLLPHLDGREPEADPAELGRKLRTR